MQITLVVLFIYLFALGSFGDLSLKSKQDILVQFTRRCPIFVSNKVCEQKPKICELVCC
jgi:hypothetical protein